jgi:hypothetical protein
LKEGLSWAKKVYDKLILAKQTEPQAQSNQEQAQICAIHSTPMTWMVTAKGAFWSCHKRLPDGSYWPYKPQRGNQQVGFTLPPQV